MPKISIDDLRLHLFATIEELRDPDSKIDLNRVNAINATAGMIIQSGKVEVAFLNATGEHSGQFFAKDRCAALASERQKPQRLLRVAKSQ